MTVEKGSVTVNGVSLTVCNSQENSFEVAIIPYTLEHTNFKYFKEGSVVNLIGEGKVVATVHLTNGRTASRLIHVPLYNVTVQTTSEHHATLHIDIIAHLEES